MDKQFNYEAAFLRNIGLITLEDQETLRNSHVAIAGLGGVGGEQGEKLCRAGIGKITHGDPENFGVTDTNRQYGARSSTTGLKKADIMDAIYKDINPSIQTRKFYEVNEGNIDSFIELGCNAVIDAIEYFAFDAKIALHRRAQELGIYVFTSPIPAFGTSLLVFSPEGPNFEEFTGVSKDKSDLENAALLAEKMAPIKPDYILPPPFQNALEGKGYFPTFGPSVGASASLLSYEVLFHILKKRDIITVPKVMAIDFFKREYRIIDFGKR